MITLSNLEFDHVYDTLNEIKTSLEHSTDDTDNELDLLTECQEMLSELYQQQREEAIRCLETTEAIIEST